MKLKINEIYPNIHHIKFKNQYEITSTMMRISEFYESNVPKICGKWFTVWQLMDAYAKKFGNFTYFTDWRGYNIPGNVLRKFFKLYNKEDLTKKEKEIYAITYNLICSNKKFYLIMTYEDDDINHELAHAFWNIYPEYKKYMKKLIKEYKYTKEFKKLLFKEGYNNKVIEDEIQAYFAERNKKHLMKTFKFKKEWKIPIEFKKYFTQFKKEVANA